MQRVFNARAALFARFILLASIPIITIGCSDQTGPSALLEGLLTVETVSAEVTSHRPAVIQVHVTGFLADPCTELDRIEQTRIDNEFEARMLTIRRADAICIQVIVPYEDSFRLDHDGLSPGEYSVLVNGVRADFSIG